MNGPERSERDEQFIQIRHWAYKNPATAQYFYTQFTQNSDLYESSQLHISTNMTPETLSLVGKVALITGSGKEDGIGAAIARRFARNGASVAIHHVSDRSKSRAEFVAAEISKEFGTKTTVVRGAIQEIGSARKIVEDTLKAFDADHIDILGMFMKARTY